MAKKNSTATKLPMVFSSVVLINATNLSSLVDNLPKTKLSEDEFKEYMKKNFYFGGRFHGDDFIGGSNYSTVVRQLGLYHILNNQYIPRFYSNISESIAELYLRYWLKLYIVPNPTSQPSFKKSFKEPVYLLKEIISFVENNPTKTNIYDIVDEIFGQKLSRNDKHNLPIIIDKYSDCIKIDKNDNVVLKENYIQIMNEINTLINDPNRYFNHFGEERSSFISDEDRKQILFGKYIPFLTALRTKPFMLLAGISGTGKSRIVRKLAQATVTEELQKKYDPEYLVTDFQNDRWNLHKPANFELIQVKPNWHNSMDVVGYLSNIPAPHYVFTPFIEFVAKAWQNPDIPFFLCLDEMNLAPVEEYFAEFLSAIESRSFENDEYETDPIIKPFVEFGDDVCMQMLDHLLGKVDASTVIANSLEAKLVGRFTNKGITLPKNLFVLGTVNMDETTFSFSRKVLDRAMSIEMNEVDYDMFLENLTDDGLKALVKEFEDEKYGKGVTLNDLLVNRHIDAKEITGSMQRDAQFVIKYLTRINKLLDGTPFKLGYRAANEAIIYVKAAEEFGCGDVKTALDHFTIMKILSRLEGDESKLTVLENEKRLADANLNIEKVKEDGKITLLTCLREIIKQELGIYTTKNAISTESEDNIGEGAEKQESDNTPQDEDSENNDTSEQAIEETESNAVVPTNAVNSINENSLKSVVKLDSMIIQLHRDHFVSYWN